MNYMFVFTFKHWKALGKGDLLAVNLNGSASIIHDDSATIKNNINYTRDLSQVVKIEVLSTLDPRFDSPSPTYYIVMPLWLIWKKKHKLYNNPLKNRGIKAKKRKHIYTNNTISTQCDLFILIFILNFFYFHYCCFPFNCITLYWRKFGVNFIDVLKLLKKTYCLTI